VEWQAARREADFEARVKKVAMTIIECRFGGKE
jgi:hypothetical protein